MLFQNVNVMWFPFLILHRCEVFSGALWREVPGAHKPELPSRRCYPGQDTHCHPQHQTGPGEAESSTGCQDNHCWSHPETETGGLPLHIVCPLLLWCVLCFEIRSQKSSSLQEREAELAQLRSRFQKGDNMWKNKDEEAETKKNTESKVGWHIWIWVIWQEATQNFHVFIFYFMPFYFSGAGWSV